MLGSTVDTCSASSRVAFGINFNDFLRDWVDSAPEVDSRRFSAHMADEEVAVLVVNSGSGLRSTGFACRAVFPMIAGSLPRSAQSFFLLLSSCTWKSVHYFYEPVFSALSRFEFLR